MIKFRCLRGILTSGVLLAAAIAWGEAPPSAPRPNIVYIISDDHAFGDYGFMGHPQIRTPNLDRLAAQSARYLKGYVPSSVCRPSLATLLTGLYPHQHGIHFNHPPPGFRALGQLKDAAAYQRARAVAVAQFRQHRSLPTLLAPLGYSSFQAGKHWEGSYRDGGFTAGMTIDQPSFEQPWNRQLDSGQWVAHGNGDHGLVIGRKTMQPVFDFIDQNAASPFSLWYAPVLPHEPHDAPARYRQIYTDQGLPDHLVGYYANISWFDDTVGQLLRYLDQKQLTRSTLFVYVADNGWANAPGATVQDKRSKRSPFENGIRTPILLRRDGVIRPATHTGLVSSIDLVPTVLTAAGANVDTPRLPGIDLLPSARGERALSQDRAVVGEIYPGDATSLGTPQRDLAYRWIRAGSLKLIVPHRHGNQRAWNNYVSQLSLFDLEADPEEHRNLAHDPDYAADLQRLQQQLDQWWAGDA